MYKALKKASVSLAAVAMLVLLVAPAASARDWSQHRGAARDIVGMNVKARNGGNVGKVDDVTLHSDGRIRSVIIGLNGTDREVSVPRSAVRIHRNHVTYEGTRNQLYAMAPAYTHHGYYGDRYIR